MYAGIKARKMIRVDRYLEGDREKETKRLLIKRSKKRIEGRCSYTQIDCGKDRKKKGCQCI